MTLENYLGLCAVMLAVAVTPGPAVFAIISTTLSSGLKRSFYLNLGIIAADYIFIGLAVAGLSALSTIAGNAFSILRYIGATYLIWLGYRLFTAKAGDLPIKPAKNLKRSGIFLTGLLITLSNPKAILFYAALLPLFVDLSSLTNIELGVIMLSSSLTFGGVNMLYALIADKARAILCSKDNSGIINKTAGSLMIATGAASALKP